MLLDHLIDELVRLQNRYPGLIWRLWKEQDIHIEFFLEELAFDCAASFSMSGIEAVHLAQTPRVVRIPVSEPPQKSQQILSGLRAFLERIADQTANYAENSKSASNEEEIVI